MCNVVVILWDNINTKEILFSNTYFNVRDDKYVEINNIDNDIIIAVFNLDEIIGVRMV